MLPTSEREIGNALLLALAHIPATHAQQPRPSVRFDPLKETLLDPQSANPARAPDTPALRAAIGYLRPFDRGALLSALARLGVYVTEVEGGESVSPRGSFDLAILVVRTRTDLELIANATWPHEVLVVVVPAVHMVPGAIAAGARFCVADAEILRDPRSVLAMPARLARQRRDFAHNDSSGDPTVQIGSVIFSSASCSLSARGEQIPLSRTERDVLLCLAAAPGIPVRSEELAAAASMRMGATSRYLSSVIVRLRRKLRQLGADDGLLATVHGVGYVLLAPRATEGA